VPDAKLNQDAKKSENKDVRSEFRSEVGIEINTDFYSPTQGDFQTNFKVGCIQVRSNNFERNRLVAAELGKWLAEAGWIGLVGIQTFLDGSQSTPFGFNEAKITLVPGEFQSNDPRTFHAEIPHDLRDLKEEIHLWLTEVNSSSIKLTVVA